MDERIRRLPMVYVDDLSTPVLDASDFAHLSKARRLENGAPIGLSDGRGRWQPARLAPVAEPDGEILVEAPPARSFAVGFVPVKGERPDYVVQKLVELGMDHVFVVTSSRSVVRWDAARSAKQQLRWQTTMREAGMQSRRLWLPQLHGPTEFASLGAVVAQQLGEAATVVLAEPGQVVLSPGRDDTATCVVIGPEGGWSPSELAAYPLVGLPGGVLRAETAAVAAATILAAAR